MVGGIGNSNISQIQSQNLLQQIQQEQQTQQVQAKRIQAFSDSDSLSVGQGPSANFKSAISPEMQGNINEMLSGLSADAQSAVIGAGKEWAGVLTSVGGAATVDDLAASMTNVEKALNTKDADLLACDSMLAAYAGVNDDLTAIATKCSNTTQVKGEIREDINLLRDELKNGDFDENGNIEVTYGEYSQNADGTFTRTEVTKTLSKDEINSIIDKLESTKDTLTEMNQMDMLNLQNAMNSQSQLLQTVSNLMKVMHDTAKSIIQNLR